MGEQNSPWHCQVILQTQWSREGMLSLHPSFSMVTSHENNPSPQCLNAAIRTFSEGQSWWLGQGFFSWNNANSSSFVAFLCGTTLAHPSLWFIWKWNSGKSFAPSGNAVIGRELGTSHWAHKKTKRRKPTPNREALCNLHAQATPQGSLRTGCPREQSQPVTLSWELISLNSWGPVEFLRLSFSQSLKFFYRNRLEGALWGYRGSRNKHEWFGEKGTLNISGWLFGVWKND